MTKAQALYSFFSSFDIPAFEENSVPKTAELPYLTYQLVDGERVSVVCTLFYRSSSLKEITEKSEEIALRLGLGGTIVKYDNGLIWLMRGEPFSFNSVDEVDKTIKIKSINIEIEYH